MQYAGFTVMPVVGGLFSYVLGSAKIPLVGRFMMLTQFTAPAFFVAAMAGAVFVLLWSVFQDGESRRERETEREKERVSLFAHVAFQN